MNNAKHESSALTKYWLKIYFTINKIKKRPPHEQINRFKPIFWSYCKIEHQNVRFSAAIEDYRDFGKDFDTVEDD